MLHIESRPPPCLLFNRPRDSLMWNEGKYPHLPSVEVKNAGNYTSIPTNDYVFLTFTGRRYYY